MEARVPSFRDMTPAEAETLKMRHHERRAADQFTCPHCGATTGLSASVSEAAVARCHQCDGEFYAWTVPGLIHVSAKLKTER